MSACQVEDFFTWYFCTLLTVTDIHAVAKWIDISLNDSVLNPGLTSLHVLDISTLQLTPLGCFQASAEHEDHHLFKSVVLEHDNIANTQHISSLHCS